jgi:hypothetical protein
MTKKMKQGDIVKITFLDAFGKGSWNDWPMIEEGLKNHIVAEIVGYYTTEDKNFTVLSMGIQTDPLARPFLHLEFIPKGAITEIKKLK